MKITILDPIRGFAALTVLTYHCIEHFKWESFPITWPLVWFRYGWMGVDIFFVLSGLVIGLSTFTRVSRGERGIPFLKTFMGRRFARICPLYFLTLIAYLILVGQRTFNLDFAKDAAAHLIFIHNTSPLYHGSINGSNWSVGVEMQFYLLFALLAGWLFRARPAVILASAVGVAWLWRFSTFMRLRETGDAFLMFQSTTQVVGLLDEFALGILLARFIRSENFLKLRMAKPVFKMLFLVAALMLLVLTMTIYEQRASYWNYVTMVVFFKTLLALAFAALILALSVLLPGTGMPKAVAPFAYLGTISYGLYLWHLPVIKTIHTYFGHVEPAVAFSIVLVVTLILSSMSWHYFEKPILARSR